MSCFVCLFYRLSHPVLSNLYHLPVVLHLIIKYGGYKNREYLVLVLYIYKMWLFSTMVENILICPENLLQKRKCSIFHKIFKYMIFQMRQKALLWSKGLTSCTLVCDVFCVILLLSHLVSWDRCGT